MGGMITGITRSAAPADAADGTEVDQLYDRKGRPVVAAGTVPAVGAHANAWNNQAVGAGGTSAAADCQYTPFVSAFGNASAATTITVQYSQDNANWYDGPNQVLGGRATSGSTRRAARGMYG